MATADQVRRVSDLIDERSLSPAQLGTIVWCGVVLALDGFATQSIGFLAPSMADSLHVPIRTFGPVFAAALFGLMISSMLAGPVADRVGRKTPIIVATLTFAVFSLATVKASTLNELIVLRFLTGLGLGGAIPNVVALAAEYSPKRLQQTVVTILFCGMPLGALLGGLVSSYMLPRWGWQAVFDAAGFAPLLVGLFLLKGLPESIRFLSISGKDRSGMEKVLASIAPDVDPGSVDLSPMKQGDKLQGNPLMHLFAEGRAVGTALLWVPFFMNLLMLYFIVNWLPALLRQAHLSGSAGIFAVSVFSAGGIAGSLVQGRIMSRLGGAVVLLTEFTVSLVLIATLGLVSEFPLILLVTFFLGCFIQGAQAGLNALAAMFYPTSLRSTGIGWSLAVGRLGSIVGPVLGGFMISHEWSLQQIFFAGGIPATIAAIAVLVGYLFRGGRSPYRLTA